MAELKTSFDVTGLENFVRRMENRISRSRLRLELKAVALQFLQIIEKAPIPTDEGRLASSYVVQIDSAGRVNFGFDVVYALFQDGQGRSEWIIRPVRKKLLYVPITQRGRKHRVGANPDSEGLVHGVDYVLRKQVRVPVKAFGSSEGPNRYFSGSIERRGQFFFEQMAKRFRLIINQEARKTRGKKRRR